DVGQRRGEAEGGHFCGGRRGGSCRGGCNGLAIRVEQSDDGARCAGHRFSDANRNIWSTFQTACRIPTTLCLLNRLMEPREVEDWQSVTSLGPRLAVSRAASIGDDAIRRCDRCVELIVRCRLPQPSAARTPCGHFSPGWRARSMCSISSWTPCWRTRGRPRDWVPSCTGQRRRGRRRQPTRRTRPPRPLSRHEPCPSPS
ncbi:hypothetical protein DFJ74DRAFT_743017, partial [Hyaloraphidium curvatum]